jgi:hypothetical protein
MSKTLLHEFVRNLLEYGDEFGDVDLGGWKDLMQVMGDPKQVADTVKASASIIGTKALTALKVILRGLPSTVIPFVRTNYDKIFRDEQGRLAAIKQKYPKVFLNAEQLFPTDAKLVAFMINPVMMTVSSATQASPGILLGLVEALGEGVADIEQQTKKLRSMVKGVRENRLVEAPRPKAKSNNRAKAPEPAAAPTAEKRPSNPIISFIRDRAIQQELLTAPIVQSIIKDSEGLQNLTLNEVLKLSNSIIELRTIEDIETQSPEIKQLVAQAKKQLAELDPTEQENVLDAVLKEFKSSALLALSERLETQIEEFIKANVPKQSDLIKAYSRAANRVHSLISRI